MAAEPLDRVDRAIVRELTQDGRMSVAALAERTEATYGAGPDVYRSRARERDRKQNAVNRALRDG